MKASRLDSLNMDRRMFLKGCGAALGALALHGATRAVAVEPDWTAVGAEADFPLNEPKFLEDLKLFVVRDAEGVRALTSRCTHRGCTVSWADDAFVCPCHQARFTMKGEVLKGPARDPLETIPAKIEAGQVWLGL